METEPPPLYPNAIKLYFKEDVRVQRIDILDALKVEIIDLGENMKDIVRIGQMGNQYKWYVQFKDDEWYKQLIGKKIRVKSQDVYIDDANDNSVIKTFRVLQLPPCVDIPFLEYNFKKFGVIQDILEETVKDGEYEGLGTGVYRVKMRFSKEQAKHIDEIHGVKRFLTERFVIQMVGHQNCFLCNKSDHQKKDCPNINLRCVKCKGRGHEYKECSDAKKLFQKNFDEAILELNDDDNESPNDINGTTSVAVHKETKDTTQLNQTIQTIHTDTPEAIRRISTKRLDRSHNSDYSDPYPKKDRLDSSKDSNQQSDLEDNDYQKT